MTDNAKHISRVCTCVVLLMGAMADGAVDFDVRLHRVLEKDTSLERGQEAAWLPIAGEPFGMTDDGNVPTRALGELTEVRVELPGRDVSSGISGLMERIGPDGSKAIYARLTEEAVERLTDFTLENMGAYVAVSVEGQVTLLGRVDAEMGYELYLGKMGDIGGHIDASNVEKLQDEYEAVGVDGVIVLIAVVVAVAVLLCLGVAGRRAQRRQDKLSSR